jgi:hypothetical protein
MLVFTSKQSRKLRAELPALIRLSIALGSLPKEHYEPLDRIVALFNLVSPWYDRLDELRCRLNFSSDTEIGKKIEELFQQFENVGRCQYGWNRTKKGQIVTHDDVFLGNVYGIWTFNVAQIMGWKNEDKKITWGYDFGEPVNVYDIISRWQALPFIRSHSEKIVDLIKEIEQLA